MEKCHFCGKTAEREAAIEACWIPYFYRGETEISEPVCTDCHGRVKLGEHGEYEEVVEQPKAVEPTDPEQAKAAEHKRLMDALDGALINVARCAQELETAVHPDDTGKGTYIKIEREAFEELKHDLKRWKDAGEALMRAQRMA